MKGLYKGKYLIAVYDKAGDLMDVACLPSELTCFKDKELAIDYINKIANGKWVSDRVFLIDVTEQHDDVFAEEDKLFLEFVMETRQKTITELTREQGICRRKYYRMNR